MKQILWIPLLAVALAAAGCSAMEETIVSAHFASYISAQEALAADDPEGARQALRALAEESEGELRETALRGAEAGDLATVRQTFVQLSGEIEKLELPRGYLVAYCPMANEGKGASWVQKDGDIENPYFGSEMLSCGEVVKKGQ